MTSSLKPSRKGAAFLCPLIFVNGFYKTKIRCYIMNLLVKDKTKIQTKQEKLSWKRFSEEHIREQQSAE